MAVVLRWPSPKSRLNCNSIIRFAPTHFRSLTYVLTVTKINLIAWRPIWSNVVSVFDKQGFRIFQFTTLVVVTVTVFSITEPALLKRFVLSCVIAQVVRRKGQKCTFCKSQSLISIANRLGVSTVLCWPFSEECRSLRKQTRIFWQNHLRFSATLCKNPNNILWDLMQDGKCHFLELLSIRYSSLPYRILQE